MMSSRRNVVVLMFWLAGAGASLAGEPEIYVDKTGLDFGAAYDDAPVEHCFLIENRGSESLLISRIDVGCDGCLSYLLETNSIGPGKSAFIAVTLDAGVVEGEVSRSLVLHSNAPENPILVLTLSGTVTPRFIVRPKAVSFGMLESMTSATQSVRIVGNTGLRKPLSLVSVSGRSFAGTLAKGKPEGAYDLRVCTVPPLADGLTRGEIVVSSADPADPKCVVRMGVYVRPAFCVLPERLLFKAADEEQTRIVFVRQSRGKPLAVLDAVAPSNFNCEIDTGPGSDDYRIHVRAQNLSGRKGTAGNIAIKTDDPARSEILVPVEVR